MRSPLRCSLLPMPHDFARRSPSTAARPARQARTTFLALSLFGHPPAPRRCPRLAARHTLVLPAPSAVPPSPPQCQAHHADGLHAVCEWVIESNLAARQHTRAPKTSPVCIAGPPLSVRHAYDTRLCPTFGCVKALATLRVTKPSSGHSAPTSGPMVSQTAGSRPSTTSPHPPPHPTPSR